MEHGLPFLSIQKHPLFTTSITFFSVQEDNKYSDQLHRDFLRPLLFFSCFLFNRFNLVAILFTSSIHLQYSTDYSFSFVDLFLAICFGDKERGNSCIRNQRRNVFPKLATCLLSSIIFSMVSVFQSPSHPIRYRCSKME